MQRLLFVCLTIAFTGSLLGTQAADLTKVNRDIAKEPAYTSRSARYCLLIFGPEAKAHVWLVLDGDKLYVDKNGNSDLTEKGERVELTAWSRHFPQQFRESPAVEIVINGRNWGTFHLEERRLHAEFKPIDEYEEQTFRQYQKYDGGILRLLHVSDLAPSPRGQQKPFAAKVRQSAGSDTWGTLTFARSPKDAPIVHFDGPLTLDVVMAEAKLEKGKEPFDFNITVGTRGVGKGTFAAVDYYYYDAKGNVTDVVREGLYPEVEAELPAKGRHGPPVQVTWVLKQRC